MVSIMRHWALSYLLTLMFFAQIGGVTGGAEGPTPVGVLEVTGSTEGPTDCSIMSTLIRIASSYNTYMSEILTVMVMEVTESDCVTLTAIFGGEEKMAAISVMADMLEAFTVEESLNHTSSRHHRDLIGVQPFIPQYPSLSTRSDTVGYKANIASILNTFILGVNGRDDRTDADAVGDFSIGRAVIDVAKAALTSCDNVVLEFLSAGACLGARTAAEVASQAVAITNDQIAYQDGLIDSAEIEAAYENSVILLDHVAANSLRLMAVQEDIITLLAAAGALDKAVGDVQETADTVVANVADLQEDVDDLLCPFGTTGLTQVSRGQGCDGVDQNCDGVVDECNEDQIPPEIRLLSMIPSKPFKSSNLAIAFLEAHIEVVDDCSVEFSPIQIDLDGIDTVAREASYLVTVEDLRCNAITEMIFVLPLDFIAPTISCGFFLPQDPFHVQDVTFDPFSGEIPPFPQTGDLLHIDENNFDDQDLVGVDFFYKIEVSISPISIFKESIYVRISHPVVSLDSSSRKSERYWMSLLPSRAMSWSLPSKLKRENLCGLFRLENWASWNRSSFSLLRPRK
jgi:hypothetical protein